MKKENLAVLGILLVVILIIILVKENSKTDNSTANSKRSSKPLCEGEDCCSMANKDNYTCYCSVKCGPREIGAEPNDNPQFVYPTDANGREVTQYGKKCFCQRTEKRNDVKMYLENCV